MSDLTTSPHQRQNILNNRYALQAAEQHLALGGTHFEGATVFTKQQVMALFEISDATVERYISSDRGKNKRIKDLNDVSLINKGNKRHVATLLNIAGAA